MHSRKRGVSRSTKPVKKSVPSWVKYKPKEVEMLIVKYSKEGMSPSKIGLRLRDAYGIPDVKILTKKSITQILKEKNLLSELPEDLLALIKKFIFVKKHLDVNNKDFTAKRGLQLALAKINRLAKYYKVSGRLSSDWKFDRKKASFYID